MTPGDLLCDSGRHSLWIKARGSQIRQRTGTNHTMDTERKPKGETGNEIRSKRLVGMITKEGSQAGHRDRRNHRRGKQGAKNWACHHCRSEKGAHHHRWYSHGRTGSLGSDRHPGPDRYYRGPGDRAHAGRRRMKAAGR